MCVPWYAHPGPPLPRAVCDNSHRDRAGWGHDPRDSPSFSEDAIDIAMSNRQMLLGLGCFGVTFTLTLASFQHFSTCGATSHLEHGIRSWHVVLYMIVCVFLQGQVCKRFAPEQDPPPNHRGEEASGVNASLYHSDRSNIGHGIPPV